MGTDIHFNVERRANETTAWKRVPNPIRPCWVCEATGKENGCDCTWCKGKGKRREDFFWQRNYDTFAILANVRNGTGFAGVDTGNGFRPISEPRGLPDDRASKNGDYGDHSFSWLLLSEVLAYDWTQTTTKRGMVDARTFMEWCETGRKGAPKQYCGGVSGPSVQIVSELELRKLIGNGTIRQDSPRMSGGYYTKVSWTVTYAEAAAGFLEIVHRDLVPLHSDPTLVRLVFGFDS